jgi:hypothetical protein
MTLSTLAQVIVHQNAAGIAAPPGLTLPRPAATGPSDPLVLRKLPSDVHDELDKIGKVLKKNISKRIKSHDLMQKCVATISELKSGFYPEGTRAFKSPVEFAELDAALQSSANQELPFIIKIPVGCSRRLAMEIVHCEAVLFQQQIELETQSEHFAILHGITTSEYFMSQATALSTKVPELYGLDAPLRPVLPPSVLDDAAVSMYRGIIDSISKDKEISEKKDAEHKKKRLDSDASLLREKPSVLFEAVISDKVTKAVVDAVSGLRQGLRPSLRVSIVQTSIIN